MAAQLPHPGRVYAAMYRYEGSLLWDTMEGDDPDPFTAEDRAVLEQVGYKFDAQGKIVNLYTLR